MQAQMLQAWMKPSCRGGVTAVWPATLKLIFSYESTSEDLQEPDTPDRTDILLSNPEFTEVQLELPIGRGGLLPPGLLALKRSNVALLLVDFLTKTYF